MSEAGSVAKVYLPGLNGVRFIAASAVMVHHIEQGKEIAGLDSLYTEAHPFIMMAGGLGVTLFFVLSGFLISYLLLTEIRTTGGVRIPSFYMRRVLRIWPLYFLIVALAWLIVPRIPLFKFQMLEDPFALGHFARIAFFLFLCPQFAPPGYVPSTLAGPLWSVGVEEHFYAFWPLLVRIFRGRLLWPCLAVILSFGLLRMEVRYFQRVWKDGAQADLLTYLQNVLYHSRFGCMAIGGIGAWLCLNARDRIQFLFRRDVQLVVIAGLFASLAGGLSFRLVHHEFYSVFFIVLIMNIAINPNSLLRLENSFFRFMGELSYGLYVFHWFLIVAVLNLFARGGGISNLFVRNLALYGAVFGLTTAVAALSYRWFERPFLRRKEKFSVILSGEAARPAPDRCPS
jgi:peptidoglycan/LPS O-acetylase OafA/YrhL